MMQHGRGGEIRGTAGRGSWSLRHYMTLFMAALLGVATVAAFSVRNMSEQDARQSAQGDANFAARAAATQISSDFAILGETTARLAANPQIPAVLAARSGSCNLTFGGDSPFSTGHLDVITPDGAVKCSSQPLPSGPVYGAASWLPAAIQGQVTFAPYLDPVTGQISAIVAAPVAGGLGTVAAIVALAPVGPNLASTLGGARQMEFLVTTKDGQTVLARSLQADRWLGTSLAGTAFANASDPASRPDLNGTQRIYGHATSDSTGWNLFVGADEASALSAAENSSNRLLAIILAGVSVMSVVAFLVYRRIAEPVRRLSVVMRSTTSKHSASAVVGTGAREVTALAEDFDRLMATVKSELADRLSSEQKALESERNYRMLFEGHPQPMWLYDVDTFEFLDVNASAVQRYGYSRAEFLAMTTKDIRPPQDVPKFLEILGDPMPSFDKSGPWRHVLKDGSTVQVLITSHAVRFGEHNARFVLAEDLTENQRLELELHQSQARSESDAELNRAKDEMVSMVSHELRTPLASIVGFTELLVTRDVTPELRKDYLRVMLQEGHRLTALINDFLDLRRLEGGQQSLRFAPADLTALISRAVNLFSDASGTAIETRLPKSLPLVRVDSDAVFRVLSNLLSNARKYSPEGGVIVVGAGIVDGMVDVYVQDHGLGIPVDALALLFRKFYRVEGPDRNTIKGTGLGLAICKNIIEAHGGKIGASSKGLGKGALFHFTVPMVREQAEVGDVLVVEDDGGFAHLLQAELAARNLSSIWAPDAETAEQLMTKKSARAVVLDLLLPGLPGEAFLQQLRATHGTGIPVVVMTLKDLDAEELLALQKAGVTAVLRKGAGMAETAANLIAKSLALELVTS
jgi:PAS domain S-box-containing protein